MIRIRKKEQYKITKKEKGEKETLETSIYLKDDEALKMIQNGFNAKIVGIDLDLIKICDLTTIRAKTGYKNGTLFFDKSTYFNTTDYEIEYEVLNYDDGKIVFENFLKEHNIEQSEVISKSKRAFKKFEELEK